MPRLLIPLGMLVAALFAGCGSTTSPSGGEGAAITPQVAAESDSGSAPENAAPAEEQAPAPPPKPQAHVLFSSSTPSTVHSDDITVRGTATPGSKVTVRQGSHFLDVDRQGRRWSVALSLHMGDNTLRVRAIKHGFVTGRDVVVVTRALSAAERAVIREQEAERRANQRALESAQSYIAMSGFSKQGLYEQLSSSAGEGFTAAEAQWAVDHVRVDWNAEAVESARSYLDMSPMSRSELLEQLTSSAGEGFTYEQAQYAVDKVY
jgi:hypothetical protein